MQVWAAVGTEFLEIPCFVEKMPDSSTCGLESGIGCFDDGVYELLKICNSITTLSYLNVSGDILETITSVSFPANKF